MCRIYTPEKLGYREIIHEIPFFFFPSKSVSSMKVELVRKAMTKKRQVKKLKDLITFQRHKFFME